VQLLHCQLADYRFCASCKSCLKYALPNGIKIGLLQFMANSQATDDLKNNKIENLSRLSWLQAQYPGRTKRLVLSSNITFGLLGVLSSDITFWLSRSFKLRHHSWPFRSFKLRHHIWPFRSFKLRHHINFGPLGVLSSDITFGLSGVLSSDITFVPLV